MKSDRPLIAPVRVLDWPLAFLQRAELRGWAGSAILHGLLVLILIAISQLPSVRSGAVGRGADAGWTTGILEAPGEGDGAPGPADSGLGDPDDVVSTELRMPNDLRFPTQPPIALSLPPPFELPPLTRPGGLTDRPWVEEVGFVPLANANPQGGGPGAHGSGSGGSSAGSGASFLGVGAVGKRFVYVIDRSSSMDTDNALQAAKNELLASLSRLDGTQQFQIIFYNHEVLALKPRNSRDDMFRGTDAQRLQVSEQIQSIDAAGGTVHRPAIMEALKLKPDVIFLLTDGAAESKLNPPDLEEIRRQNRRRVCIHCIEFGHGSRSLLPDADNFLQELARQNSGTYVYHQVTREMRIKP